MLSLPLPALRSLCLALLATAGNAAVAAVQAAAVEVLVSDASGKPLAGAAVFLESKEARSAARPDTGMEVVQQNRQFMPTISVVTVGTAVAFPNRDTVRHHVYSF